MNSEQIYKDRPVDKYRKAMESLFSFVFLDANLCIKEASPRFISVLGYAEEDLIGKNIFLFILEPTDFLEKLRLLSSSAMRIKKFRLRTKSGKELVFVADIIENTDTEIAIGFIDLDTILAAGKGEELDDKTELYNYKTFNYLAVSRLRSVFESGHDAVFFIFDLDDFKQINDRFGHVEGDSALREIRTILHATFLRGGDIIGRRSEAGDEFLVLATAEGHDRRIRINLLLKRLEANISESNEKRKKAGGYHKYDLSLTAGFARFNQKKKRSLKELEKIADRMMLCRKKIKNIKSKK